ncbi:MAG: hypothetical protein JW863_07790 [Chitinispirillaceae bacterium]|nr:hypothetical protein [Chitinispirillaceae bacterium]
MNKALRNISVIASGIVVSLAGATTFAAPVSSLQWRVFSRNENTWIYHPNGLMLFSTLTRTIKPVTIDVTRPVDTLFDCVEFEDYLWISSDAGVYQIDMASQSIERISLSETDSTAVGKIALDADYLWLGTADRLLRFDKLGREWLSFPLPEAVGRMVGLWSNGDEVYCAGDDKLFRFTSLTEKWNRYPVEKPFGPDAVFYPGGDAFKIIENERVATYQPSTMSWLSISLGTVPVDLVDEDSVVYFCRGTDLMKLSIGNETVQRIDLPAMHGIGALTKVMDTVFVTTGSKIAKGNVRTLSMSFVEYPVSMKVSAIQKIVIPGKFIIVFTTDVVHIYDAVNRVWQEIPRTEMRQSMRHFVWKDDGMTVNYTKGYQSKLTGSIQGIMALQSSGYEYDTIFPADTYTVNDSVVIREAIVDTTDSILVMKLKLPNIYANLNLHTTDPADRVADVFFDNSSTISVPKKGVYFRGNRDDYLNTFRLGTTSNDQSASALLPEVTMEGGSAVLESRQRLKERDRKIVRLAGGTGMVTTRSEWRMLPYRADGTYYLKSKNGTDTTEFSASEETKSAKDTVIIVPGSLEVLVDGDPLDSIYYVFDLETGKLEFRSSAPVDPVSSITVRYQVQTRPEGGMNEVELLPSRYFKRLHYGALTVSPREWISTRVGVNGIEDSGELHPVVDFSVPVEIRNTSPDLMLKMTPQVAYDVKNKAHALNGTLQSRIGGKTGFVLNGMMVDDNFTSTDTLTRGFGATRDEFDVAVTHDITQELPLRYYQHRRDAARGTEERFAFNAGVQYQDYPFLDLSLSRMTIDRNGTAVDTAADAFDSLFSRKDKLGVRLYEVRSPLLEKVTRFDRVSYDFSHSEYRYQTAGSDEWAFGRITNTFLMFAPIQQVTILNKVRYRGGMNLPGAPNSDVQPIVQIQTVDAPRGIDLYTSYQMKYSRYHDESAVTDSIIRSFEVILKPGLWYAPLGWFSPRAEFTQNINCRFHGEDFRSVDLLTGSRGRESASQTRGVGVNIAPSDAFLFRTMNNWSESDASGKFKSNNDVQYWLNARNYWQGIWNYTGDFRFFQQDGSFVYNRIWTSWLRTIPAVLGSVRKDSTGTKISAGPKLTVNFNVQKFLIIKNLFNSHDLKVLWKRADGSFTGKPDIGYTFNIQLILFPNIQITNYESIQFFNGGFSSFESRIGVLMNF